MEIQMEQVTPQKMTFQEVPEIFQVPWDQLSC